MNILKLIRRARQYSPESRDVTAGPNRDQLQDVMAYPGVFLVDDATILPRDAGRWSARRFDFMHAENASSSTRSSNTLWPKATPHPSITP